MVVIYITTKFVDAVSQGVIRAWGVSERMIKYL